MITENKTTNPVKILMHIPVPWVFILTFLLGLGMQYILPINLHFHHHVPLITFAGAILFATGVFLAAWSLVIFRREKTTTTPGLRSKKLVIWGPYRYTRNPMYVSLILAYLGEITFFLQIWPLLVLPLVVAYINQVVIPVEEELLHKEFKEEYDQYCTRVRRWL